MRFLACLVFGMSFVLNAPLRGAERDGSEGREPVLGPTFAQLHQIRSGKERDLQAYFTRMQKLADGIPEDKRMMNFFKLKLDLAQRAQVKEPPEDLKQAIENLDKSVQEHYLRNYMAFYDMLCIDRAGNIFHTIRKEEDVQQNVFKGRLASTALSKHLKASPEKALIDYQFYTPSGEPSAFFVEPVKDGGKLLGWFVLQCAINKINRMFSQSQHLGRTGEVILVNQQRYMLTDSRFLRESSILKRSLSKENIREKFRLGSGNRIVTDYRGRRAITAFSTIDVGSAKWLAIAKIDEDEVVSNLYRQTRSSSRDILLKGVASSELKPVTEVKTNKPYLRVDMDEFRRAGANEGLVTYGVSTCTAIIFSCPGKFSYMAHLSVYDKMYGNDGTDLLGNVVARILNFELPRGYLRQVKITFVAPHLKSFGRIVDELLDRGFFLSQMTFVHNAKAEFVNVYQARDGDDVRVLWEYPASSTPPLPSVWSTQPSDLGTLYLKQLTGSAHLSEDTYLNPKIEKHVSEIPAGIPSERKSESLKTLP